MKKFLLLLILAVSFFGFQGIAKADSYGTDPAVLKKLEELASLIKNLQGVVENQNEVIQSQAKEIKVLQSGESNKTIPYIPSPAESQKSAPASWLDGMQQGGDFRLRYEGFHNHGGTDQDRNRFRVRLRYGIEKKLGEDFTVGFRLSTGGTADPTSTVQTLGGDFVYKSVVFDKLFAKYAPGAFKDYGPVAKVEVGGGKTENPFLRGAPQSQMVWDHDVTPEGIYETVDFKPVEIAGAKLSPFLIGGQFPVVENAVSGSTDAELIAFMGGFNLEAQVRGFEKPVSWSSALGYYDYLGFAEDGNFGAFARGNSVDPASATTLVAKDFNILNIYNQIKIPTKWVPVVPFFDYATNLGDRVGSLKPGNLNDAFGYGLKLGEAKKKGEWETSYSYYFIQPNAVVGAFNDSDFGGAGFNGHADRRGSIIKFGYKLTDYLTLNLAGYFVSTLTHSPNENTQRYQADLGWKF